MPEMTNLNLLDLSFVKLTPEDLLVVCSITSLAVLNLAFCNLPDLPERFVFLNNTVMMF